MNDFNSATKRMETQLRSYLETLRVKKGEPFTHTTKSPAASYYIGEDDIEIFTTLYCNAISKGVRPTVTERPNPVGPLRFDFDFKSSLDDGLARKYTDKILTSIIGFIQDEIKNAIATDIPNPDIVLRCVVLEKKAPRVEEGRIKDGFHLHFPNFPCEGWFQDEYLRNKITEKMITSKIWDGIKFLDPVDKFIDTGMAKKQWLMYGSAKAEGAEPFMVTKCYGPRDTKTGNLTKISVAELFEAEMEGRKSRPAYYLPRFMSIKGYLEATPLKQDIEARRAAYRTRKTKRGIMVRKRSIEDVMEDVKTIKEGGIMDMLSDSRADEYNSWIDVGWTLFNIGQGCDELLQLWIDFSRRSSKFVEGDCEERWAKMDMRDKTIGSLFSMARSDSPDLYKSWKDMNIKTHLDRSLYEDKPNEWDVAQVVLKLYKDRFLCADAKKDIWYEFVGHRWQFMDDNVALRKLLATEVVNLYYIHKSDLAKSQIGEQNDTERSKLEAKETKCRRIITALKECKFQERLIKMCKVVFHDPLFLKRIDENKLLFVCENGVLDFELMGFRDGRPDDYTTLSCNVIYPRNATHNDDEYLEVEDYLKKVFPNPNLRQYFKDTSSAALEGGNVNKTFIVGTGSGDNAKTVTYTFLEMTFGEYCIKFPRELFVIGKGNSSGAARPELARVRGKRLAIVSEIAKTETLNIGILKELTGNDSFFTRGIYEKGTEIKPMFTLCMQCQCFSTPVALPGGISMPLGELSGNLKVLAWDSKTKGLIPATQKKFLEQGIKKCVKVVLKDGSFVECTPDHRLLTSEGEWIEAKDIVPEATKLKMGIHQPFYEDLKEKCDYNFLDREYNLNTLSGKMKAMAVCRILGYGLADGSMNKCLLPGHMIDAKSMNEDIKLLTGKNPTIGKCNAVFKICLPVELERSISSLCAPQPGGRVNNLMVLPEFIFDEECPNFLIREVLAGMFGGDGVVPCINKSGSSAVCKMFSPMRYIASKINKYIPSLVEQFQRVVDLLWNRFGIEACVEKPLEYDEGKSRVQININKWRSVKIFIEKIGVRYCCHKAYRLTSVLSYYKYKQSVMEQSERIVTRTKELVDICESHNPKCQIAQYDLQNNLIDIYDSTQTAQHATSINHSLINGACKRNGKSKGFYWSYYSNYSSPDEINIEEGCETIKEALDQAIKEEPYIHSKSMLPTYTQVRHRILKGDDYTQQQLGDNVEKYLTETGLYNFCMGDGSYAVDAFSTTLPTYSLEVIAVRPSGDHEVFDLTIEEPYSNYMSNGMISHNCNEPPRVPGHDDATWNRIRVLDYESRFVKLVDIDKFPVPESVEEQFKMKRFMADNTFMRKLPDLCPYLLWMLFDNYKIYKKNGLKEPVEVRGSTNVYRQHNDVYIQYVGERILKASPEDIKLDTEQTKFFLKLTDLHTDFTTWYHENHSSYAKEKFNKITLKQEFNKRFPGAFMTKVRTQGWYGYSIIPDDDNEGTFGTISATKNAAAIKQIIDTKSKAKGKVKMVGTAESTNPIPGTKPIASKISQDIPIKSNTVSKAKVAPKAKSINLIVEDLPSRGIPISMKTGTKSNNTITIRPIAKAKVIKID